MAENRWLNEEYAKIGQRLIDNDEYLTSVKNGSATIVYLSSDYAKKSHGKPVYGECEKVASKWKWSVPADFTITVYEPNVAEMDEGKLQVVIYHELLHVGISYDKDGNEVHSIVPHDINEFTAVAERFGIDWDY